MNIGVIGYGLRLQGMASLVLKRHPEVNLTAIVDVDWEKVEERLLAEGLDKNKIRYYSSAVEMLANEDLDGVMIGTRCNLHTQYAIEVMKTGIPIFLEKPVSTNMEDLRELEQAGKESNSPIVVSFPLRLTEIAKFAKDIVDSGEIGTIENVNAWNDVPYGSVYFHNWYRDESITQGLFLQKATHDFDLINYMVGIKPAKICAMTSKQIFKGHMPANLKCDDCEKKETCQESKFYYERYRRDHSNGEYCCYATDTGNEDSGSAIIRYETGMHASYSQNFYARHKAARRGMRLFGYKGTLEFDFYADDIIRVYSHLNKQVSVYNVPKLDGGHGGGDIVLADNFVNVMKKKEESKTTLDLGILSALMCLKAKESANRDVFCDIKLY
ncbi:MAG: Gfo/Idh/MocA family oxidoreductase [Lachnospiraceae bacterium]